MSRTRRFDAVTALVAATFCGFLGVATTQAAPAVVEDFSLPRWPDGPVVKLSDFAGQIVVLDFFAYWCAPCRLASKEIEEGIQKHYAAQRGNPHGVPVRVLSINIERDNPAQTKKFIRETGLEFVLNDFDDALLAKFGGAATPFLVVLDGARGPGFRVVYQSSGFDGTRPLRSVIDATQPPKTSARRELNGPLPTAIAGTTTPLTQKAEADFEGLLSSDIQLTGTTLRYDWKKGGTEWRAVFSYNTIDLDYKPFTRFDVLTQPRSIHEDYFGGRASVRQALGDRLAWLGAVGTYDGFRSFRSVWLDDFYRQRFSGDPLYFPSNPQGFNASTGLRWEYQPTTGFAEANFAYAYDQVSPGWDLPGGTPQNPTPPLEHGRDILHTYAPGLKFENVLTSRVRALHEFQLAITSGRDPRYIYRGYVNVALGERWTCRASGGYTQEDPEFEAWFAGATLEYELTPRWFLNVSGRYYTDTGEVEDPAVPSSAAPGLQTWQIGGGLRYAGGRHSFKLYAAPHFARYEPLDLGTREFTHLYRDRDWFLLQAAWAVEF